MSRDPQREESPPLQGGEDVNDLRVGTAVANNGPAAKLIYLIIDECGPYTRGGIHASIQAAIDADDLLAYRDADGELRLTSTDGESPDRLAARYPNADALQETV